MRDSVEMEYDKLQNQYSLHVCNDAIVVRHIMPLLSMKLSEKLVKALACEVVTVRMGLDLVIF